MFTSMDSSLARTSFSSQSIEISGGSFDEAFFSVYFFLLDDDSRLFLLSRFDLELQIIIYNKYDVENNT